MSKQFVNTCDPIYWTLIQNQILFNYTLIPQKQTNVWLKDLSYLYDTQTLLAGDMICRKTIMKDVSREKVGPTTTMPHYYDTSNSARFLEWDKKYEN